MLKLLRKFRIASYGSLFAAFALLIVQCTPNVQQVDELNCISSFGQFENYTGELVQDTEFGLEVLRSLKSAHEFKNLEEMQAYIIGQENIPTARNAEVVKEINKYHEMGFSSYLNFHVQSGKLSSEFVNFMNGFKESIISLEQPNSTQADFLTAIDAKMQEASTSSSMCEKDKVFAVKLMQSLKGATNFYFKHNPGISERACDIGEWFLQFSCFLFAMTAIIIISALIVVAAIAAAIEFLITKTDEFGNPTSTTVSGDDPAFIGLVWFLVGVFSYNFWYQMCCDWDNEIDCSPPTGMTSRPSCGKTELTVVGPGAYNLTSWDNENALPATATTSKPTIILEAIDPSLLSTAVAATTCINNDGSFPFTVPWSGTIPSGFASLPSIAFSQTPPSSNPVKGTSYPVTISGYDPNPQLTYFWEPNSTVAYDVYGSAPAYTIYIKQGASGWVTPTLKVRNSCTNEVKSISFTMTWW